MSKVYYIKNDQLCHGFIKDAMKKAVNKMEYREKIDNLIASMTNDQLIRCYVMSTRGAAVHDNMRIVSRGGDTTTVYIPEKYSDSGLAQGWSISHSTAKRWLKNHPSYVENFMGTPRLRS